MPIGNLPMGGNPMGLDSQSGAGMVNAISSPMTQSPPSTPTEPTEPNPAEKATQDLLMQFKSSWTQLEQINSKFDGDEEAFKNLQKAAETWLSSMAGKMSDSVNNQGY